MVMNRFMQNHLCPFFYEKELRVGSVFPNVILPTEPLLKNPVTQLVRIALSLFILILFSSDIYAKELNLGVSVADITPALPVALDGQMHLRIALRNRFGAGLSVTSLISAAGDQL